MFWLENPTDPDNKDSFPSSNEEGSHTRFESRQKTFKLNKQALYKHHVWWFIHNVISHPLIGILPTKPMFDFHDWTSKKINGH